MSTFQRYSKCVIPWQKCQEPKCDKIGEHIGGLYYGDNDTIYCYNHVIGHINPWRITSCSVCNDQIEQIGNTCKKCNNPL